MTQSTKAIVSPEQGVSTVTFVIVIGFIVLLALFIGAYVVIMDRLNADDAYRVKELRDQRDNLKSTCDENFATLNQIQDWSRQNPTVKVPLNLLKVKLCPPITPIEKPRDGKE